MAGLSNSERLKEARRKRAEENKNSSSLSASSRHSDKIEKLRYIDGKSDWIDLRAADKIELKQGEFKLILLGVAMQLS